MEGLGRGLRAQNEKFTGFELRLPACGLAAEFWLRAVELCDGNVSACNIFGGGFGLFGHIAHFLGGRKGSLYGPTAVRIRVWGSRLEGGV